MDKLLARIGLVSGDVVVPSSILRCPSEVLSLVFRCLLDEIPPVSSSFCDQRAKLSLVCRLWWSVVVGDAALWQHVIVTPSSDLDVVDRVMQITRGHGLSVYLVDNKRSELYGGSDRRRLLLTVFNRILPSSPRWFRLEIVTTSTYAHKAMLDHLDNLNCPRLRSITLRSPNRAAILSPSPLAVILRCSALQRLVIHRCNFPENVPESLPNLRVLSLCDLPTIYSPTEHQLFLLLRCAPQLRRLEMVRMGLRIRPDFPEPAVERAELPSVTILILAFNVALHPGRAFFRVLRHLDVPNLQHLHLGLPTDSDVKYFLGADPVLHSPSLSIAGRLFDPGLIHRLLSTFPRVGTLDLVDADRPVVLRQLGSVGVDGAPPRPLIMGSLTRIRVRPSHWNTLIEGLAARRHATPSSLCVELVPHEGAVPDVPDRHSSTLQLLESMVESVVWGRYVQHETHELLRFPGLHFG
ncbi:hypothetical protein R3P38DRAFT_3171598 [Favolaschia claudopus]|uniref:F-box domain-containing protein n=1 Tax=Favolaschia claudopus TaxID=2862362 RepID=A0AAW0DQY8_9AGAR